MGKILSFASWNVKHFKGDNPERVKRVVDLLNHVDPDIFALYELTGKEVFQDLMKTMSTHSFMITEKTGMEKMEFLIGFRKGLSVFITHREEFKSGMPTLRPGTLVTVDIDDAYYSMLFLHLKSFPDPRSWGLRDNMFEHIASLKRKLDTLPDAEPTAKFIAMGDFNTMGLKAPYNDISDLDANQEIQSIEERFSTANMRRLTKTSELTWWNGRPNYEPGSNLDHVFADINLKFKKFDNNKEIKVFGWPEESNTNDQMNWIENFSDHALLYGEIHAEDT